MTRRGPSRPIGPKARARNRPVQRATPSNEPDLRRAGPISPDEVARLLETITQGDRHAFDALPRSHQEYFLRILGELLATGRSPAAKAIWELDYERLPVSIDTFLDDPDYLGAIGRHLYDPWRRELQCVCDPRRAITEWIVTGAIGTGKTTAAVIALLYKIYRLTCLRDPQSFYGLIPGSPIVFGLFNLTLDLAHSVSYKKFLNVFRASPYFGRLVTARIPRVVARIDLPKNIVCALGSNVIHALGQDLFGGILSEVNFARRPEAEQVVELYTGVTRRLESRFLRPETTLPNPGFLILDSSPRDQHDWLERHMAGRGDGVHVTSFALWDVKQFPGPRFSVLLGDRTQTSRILAPGDAIPQGTPSDKVIHPPESFRSHFERDVDGALRDIAGVATYAGTPLIADPSRVEACVDPLREHPFQRESICLSLDDPRALMQFVREPILFARSSISGQPWRLKLNPGAPRFIHVDLALSEDCAALAMCHVSSSRVTALPNSDGTLSRAQVSIITVDLILRVVPPRSGQIDLGKIRSFILMLRERGVPIAHVSYDDFQSADSIQILKKEGIPAKLVSVDTNPGAYFALRAAIDERRIRFYRYPPFIDEITTVQFDPIRKKVDHRPGGSKDCADAVAGAVFAAITDAQARPALPPLGPLADRLSGNDDFHWVMSDYRDAQHISGVSFR
jgi:hypothetical protein